MSHNNEHLLENAKHGFEHIKERILIESKECNPRIVVTAEKFGHQSQILHELLKSQKEEQRRYFHENARTNAQAHRNLKACECMRK